jgi:hypothetical protein
MIQTVENIESYHNVFAQLLSEYFNAIGRANDEGAKKLAVVAITYAYTMYICDVDPDITPEKITAVIKKMTNGKKDLDELSVLMTYYQSKAGLKPIQSINEKARMFERFRKKTDKEE